MMYPAVIVFSIHTSLMLFVPLILTVIIRERQVIEKSASVFTQNR